MKISPISNVNFTGKIIDAHAHLGTFADGFRHTVDNFTAEDIVEIANRPINDGQDTLEKVIVSNLDGVYQNPEGFEDVLAKKGLSLQCLSEYDANMNILKECRKNPILKPLAICQPERHTDASEIRKVLQQGEFFGLKFHPEYTKVGAENSIYEPYMRLADEFKLPCLFHCDASGSKFSSPRQIYELAKKFPKVPVILAHLGAGPDECHQKAVDVILESVKNNDATLYADISWVDCDKSEKNVIISALHQLQNSSKGDMTERLLFGTDAPIGDFGAEGFKNVDYYGNNVRDIKNSIRKAFGDSAETLIDKLFYRNAEELFFGRKNVANPVETVIQQTKNNKFGKFAAFGAVLVGAIIGVGCALKNRSDKKD